MNRPEILDAAKKCVCGEREQDYGSPENNFGLIGMLWTTYLGTMVTAEDVAMMMSLLKIARIKTGKGTADSFVDLAGYAACAGEIATQREPRKEADSIIFTKANQCVMCGEVIPEGMQVCPECLRKWGGTRRD